MHAPHWSHEGVRTTVLQPLGWVPGHRAMSMAFGLALTGLLLGQVWIAIGSAALVIGVRLACSTWRRPVVVELTFQHVRIGDRRFARDRIVRAAGGESDVMLLLDDGSVVHTPPLEPAVRRAVERALEGPSDWASDARATRALAGVRAVR